MSEQLPMTVEQDFDERDKAMQQRKVDFEGQDNIALARRGASDLDYAMSWAEFAKRANLVPAETNKFQAAAIVQTGKELGIQPLQALRQMSFIKGRLTMYVQLQLAMAMAKGVQPPQIVESPGKCSATLTRNSHSVTCEYTLEDARKAGLARPDGSYDKYLRQMLRWRAIGDALRLIAPDAVLGILSPEEAETLGPVLVEGAVVEKEETLEEAELRERKAKAAKAAWDELLGYKALRFTSNEDFLLFLDEKGILAINITQLQNEPQLAKQATEAVRELPLLAELEGEEPISPEQFDQIVALCNKQKVSDKKRHTGIKKATNDRTEHLPYITQADRKSVV